MNGVVIKSTGSWYVVRLDDGSLADARIKGKFRMKGIKSTNPVAVGDRVIVQLEADGNALIEEILERKNYIIRKSINLSKRSHIIAANIDQAILVVTLAQPQTFTAFIDRFLVSAEAYHIPTIIVFNKVDLYTDEEQAELNELKSVYSKVGYTCLETSATEKKNIDQLAALLKDRVSVISGHSGVGKSTLLNAIDPQLDLKTGHISGAHLQGKHTTTFAEMVSLHFGGDIIDTPGIKAFGLIDFDKSELSHYFLEMRSLLEQCHFNNCQHLNEPKCAIKEAVESGEIAEFRYANYVSIHEDDEDENYRTKGY
ncbi:MAG: ribosome small subunit-dependent GTPase A [Flavobacteriales bacterium]|nr:ribosome small subunit-dependent GTPase A [Flavobacteriales bacterium]